MDFDAESCISAMQEEMEWQMEQWRKEREEETCNPHRNELLGKYLIR